MDSVRNAQRVRLKAKAGADEDAQPTEAAELKRSTLHEKQEVYGITTNN